MRLRDRPLDAVFAVFFGLFTLGWLVFDLPAATGVIDETTGFYAREIDPLFRDPPLWLEAVGWMAACYGPVYAALAYGLVRGRRWVDVLALPFAGLITGSNAVYVTVEVFGDLPPANPAVFWLLNTPYFVVPVLLAIRSAVRVGRRSPVP